MAQRRRPARPPVRRGNRASKVTIGTQHLTEQFEFDWQRAAPEAARAVKGSRRAVPDAQASINRRNLRALSIAPIREDMPNLLPFDSSRVLQAGYSPRTHTLYVRFVDGTPWAYYNVEPNIWRNFRRSASPGRYINRVLNSYAYGPSNFGQ
jgi:hypothetical protein